MPRYFFHSLNGHTDHDIDGTELSDDHAATIQGVIYAGEILRNEPTKLCTSNALRVEVTDATAKVLLTIVTKLEKP